MEWLDALGPVASGFGAAFGAIQSAGAQRETNAMNRELAQQQMAFQERMSSTSYQRGVKDMKAAGINPMLAFSQGGASSPQGASAQMVAPDEGAAVREAVANSINSAMEMGRYKRDMEVGKTQVALNAANTLAAEESANLSKQSALKVAKDREAVEAGLPAVRAESASRAKVAQREAGKDSDVTFWTKQLGPALGAVTSAFERAKKSVPERARQFYRFMKSPNTIGKKGKP